MGAGDYGSALTHFGPHVTGPRPTAHHSRTKLAARLAAGEGARRAPRIQSEREDSEVRVSRDVRRRISGSASTSD